MRMCGRWNVAIWRTTTKPFHHFIFIDLKLKIQTGSDGKLTMRKIGFREWMMEMESRMLIILIIIQNQLIKIQHFTFAEFEWNGWQ